MLKRIETFAEVSSVEKTFTQLRTVIQFGVDVFGLFPLDDGLAFAIRGATLSRAARPTRGSLYSGMLSGLYGLPNAAWLKIPVLLRYLNANSSCHRCNANDYDHTRH